MIAIKGSVCCAFNIDYFAKYMFVAFDNSIVPYKGFKDQDGGWQKHNYNFFNKIRCYYHSLRSFEMV